MVHITQRTSGVNDYLPPFVSSLMYNGLQGVQLFYVLSAFTLFLSFADRQNERTPVKNYFIRRFFRIAPLYYLAVVIYYLIRLNDNSISAANLLSNFVFLHGLSPYWINNIVPGSWSVAVEVSFYCMLPWLFKWIKNIEHACIFLIISLVIRYTLYHFLYAHSPIADIGLWEGYMFYYFPNQLPVFAVGVILYFLIYDKDNLKIRPKTAFAAFIIISACVAIKPEMIFKPFLLFSFSFLVLILSLRSYHPRVLFNPIITYIGEISYTLYLSHFGAIFLLERFNCLNLIHKVGIMPTTVNFIINYLLVLGIAGIISSVLFYSIELPMQNFGKKLIKRMSHKANLIEEKTSQ